MRLIDADKLYAKIAANTYLLSDEVNSQDYGMFLIGIRQAINEAPTVKEWIPVSEKLPDDNEEVLGCNKNGYMITGQLFMSADGKECSVSNGDDYMDYVVAWMPLPKSYNAG